MNHLHTKQQTNKYLREIETTSKRIGYGKNVNYIRDFSFVTDQSIKAGGTNEAPSPMEYVLGSFNGCVLVVIERIADEIEFTYTHLSAKSIGTVDPRGTQAVNNISPHFKSVTNTIWFETNESKERLSELKELVTNRCPALNLFLDAGVIPRSRNLQRARGSSLRVDALDAHPP